MGNFRMQCKDLLQTDCRAACDGVPLFELSSFPELPAGTPLALLLRGLNNFRLKEPDAAVFDVPSAPSKPFSSIIQVIQFYTWKS